MKLYRSLQAGCLTMTLALLVIPNAFAEGAAASPGGGLISLFPLLLIMVIFYFLLIRPQQKRLKEHRSVIESLKAGDKIITSGGLYGTIKTVNEIDLKVEIAQGVRVTIKRDSVASLSD